MNDLERVELLKQLTMDINSNPYRPWYQRQPEICAKAVSSWAEFKEAYEATEHATFKIPDTPPTLFGPMLDDVMCFPSPPDDVAFIENLPYCPPFLHRLSFIKIVYVLRGSCYFYMDNQIHRLEEGNFLMVGPGTVQSVFSSDDKDIVVNLLIRTNAFSDSFLTLLETQSRVSESLWKLLYHRDENLALCYEGPGEAELSDLILETIHELVRTQNRSNLIAGSLIRLFLGTAIRKHGDAMKLLPEEKHRGRYLLPSMIFYMKQHLSTTLTEVADAFNLSEAYVSRYFRRETGKTFRSILTDLRMRQAAVMLENADFSVELIIESVGYTDRSQFYRNFDKTFNMSPIQYRKRQVRFE